MLLTDRSAPCPEIPQRNFTKPQIDCFKIASKVFSSIMGIASSVGLYVILGTKEIEVMSLYSASILQHWLQHERETSKYHNATNLVSFLGGF